MKKMKFSEYLAKQETGLFTKIDELFPFEWNEFYTPEQLDILFLFKHGNKFMLNSLYTTELDTLAKIVYTSYGIKWEQIFKSLLQENEPLNQMYKLTVDEVITSDDELSQINERVNKEGAFNTEVLVASGGTDDTSTIENRENRQRLTTQARIDSETLQKNIQFMEEHLFIDIVLNDVNDLILLKIY